MKMNYSRLFAAVLVLQFTNVQVQAAFGSEAVALQNPEVQYALKRAESRIANRVDGLTEEAQLKLAHRLYRYSVSLRNRLQKKSDAAFEKRLAQLKTQDFSGQEEGNEVEDAEIVSTLKNELGLQETHQDAPIPMTRRELKRSQLLAQADHVLTTLGARKNASGKFEASSRSEFKSTISTLEEKDLKELRAPAAARSLLVKIILVLVILTLGISVMVFSLGWMALILAWGSGNIWLSIFLIIVAAGALVGMIFGIRAVVSQADRGRSLSFTHA